MYLVQQGSTPNIPIWTNVASAAPTNYYTIIGTVSNIGAGAITPVNSWSSLGPITPNVYAYSVALQAIDTATLGPMLVVGVTGGGNIVGVVECQVVSYDPATGPTGGTPPTPARRLLLLSGRI